MLGLSRKSLLALEAVIDVAVHARPDPVQARDITRRQGVPQRYLEQIMQTLVRADILRGVRGPRGGYRLARERRRIAVSEIVRVIDAPDAAAYPTRSALGEQVIRPFCEDVHGHILARLDDMTVADLCNNLDEVALTRNAAPTAGDFTI